MSFTFDHIHLRTSDIAGTVKFYQANLGADGIDTSRPDGTIGLHIGGTMVLISPIQQGQAVDSSIAERTFDHFAVTVPNIDETAARMKANGVAFTREPVTLRPGLRIAFIMAPDNVKIEIIQRG